jgi:hypothetical protein
MSDPSPGKIGVRPARPADAGLIHRFILALADDEKLSHAVRASEGDIAHLLFGPTRLSGGALTDLAR